ncbi:hypothetical protein GGQ85_004521 [Nitrobacter vulgaris]|nr:hypothetical protein [Nitrobacter vulgaris]
MRSRAAAAMGVGFANLRCSWDAHTEFSRGYVMRQRARMLDEVDGSCKDKHARPSGYTHE